MVTALNDASVIQNHDGFTVSDGGQTMRDDSTVLPSIRLSIPCCTSASVRVSMELVASSRIMAGGSATAARAMEISWRCPGKAGAVSGQHGVVTVRQSGDEAVRVGQLCSRNTLFIGCIQTSVTDILQHSSGKEVDLLQYHAERTAQVCLCRSC